MKFIVSSSLLLKNLQLVGGVLSSAKNTMIPILDDFLLELKGEFLHITASDIANTMSTEIKVDMAEGEGMIAIPGKTLIDMLKTFSEVPISFEINIEKSFVEITAGEGHYRMAGHKGEDFPMFPELENKETLILPADTLQNAINKTLFAVSNEELRPSITGVLFDITKESIIFVSTDAHKLVKYTKTELNNNNESQFIVTKKALNLLKNSLTTDDENVNIEYTDSNVLFQFRNVKIISRLISGKFPNYDAIIPKNSPNTLILDRNLFINTLRRVSFFADQSSNQIKLTITGQELLIEAEDREYENDAKEKIACNYNGTDLTIGFNSRFLLDMLTHIDDDQIKLELGEPNVAVVILPELEEETDENLFMLISPIMLNN